MSYQFAPKIKAILALLAVSGFYTLNAVAAPINGVEFAELNTSLESPEWIMDNLDPNYPSTDPYGPPGPNGPAVAAPGAGPLVTTEINKLLAQYESAGVNSIGIIIDVGSIAHYCDTTGKVAYDSSNPDHFYNPNAAHSFCKTNANYPYPQLDPDIVIAAQRFIDITNSGTYAGKFTIEIMFFTQTAQEGYLCESEGGGNIGDTPSCPDNGDPSNPTYNQPYGNAEEYLANWINGLVLNNSNIGMLLLGGQFTICDSSGCDQDSGADPEVTNNGEWIKNIWQWKKNAFPALTASYEARSLSQISGGCNVGPYIACVAHWAELNTPGLPYIVSTLYLNGNLTTASSQYSAAASSELDAYASVAPTIPLWIAEYGGAIDQGFSAQNQNTAIMGFLEASCGTDSGLTYPKFLWTASNDYNPNSPDSAQQFGLVSGFDANGNPIMEPAWTTLSQWYGSSLSSNTALANGTIYATSNSATVGNLTCGLSSQMASSTIVQNPSHGTVTITNPATGAFRYQPTSDYTGSDTFRFTVTFMDGAVSHASTESVTVYSPAEISVVTSYVIP